MVRRILIDAMHPEEVRVAVEEEARLVEFDFETETKKQIKSNIYLGKITRVEPSLQAAFVEYGGNRQGFLPFSEIHFDYYQIPVADREKLDAQLKEIEEQELEAIKAREEAEEAQLKAAEEAEKKAQSEGDDEAVEEIDGDADESDKPSLAEIKDDSASTTVKVEADAEEKPKRRGRPPAKKAEDKDAAPKEAKTADKADAEEKPKRRGRPPAKKAEDKDAAPKEAKTADKADAEDSKPDDESKGATTKETKENKPRRRNNNRKNTRGKSAVTENLQAFSESNDQDEMDEAEEARANLNRQTLYRQYKIQEVIKRGQIVLVQVIKEERGNKGASLTTYTSLAGRYCVLMPNTERAGGVSRRIQDIKERRRLKKIVGGFELPQGASVIVRTAGVGQSDAEIQRDYSNLINLWNNTKTEAVNSTAPAMIHEEGGLMNRSLRDLYRDNVDEIVVEGEGAFKAAKKFMGDLAPDHVKKIKKHKESLPILKHYGIEQQLEELYNHEAKLPSGGSIVIAQTEALVAIDVNSGKATRERSIEDTALNTNLEAAVEVARHLRLRDLAGLVVIDFIDMRDFKNRRAVEKALKDALKIDRAKIQVGRISTFGLLEMSRQRMRSSIVEASTLACPHCAGTGQIRSEESISLSILRAIENEASRNDVDDVTVKMSVQMALYLLNEKRDELGLIEDRNDVRVIIREDYQLSGAQFSVEKRRGRNKRNNNNNKQRNNDDRKPRNNNRQANNRNNNKQNDASNDGAKAANDDGGKQQNKPESNSSQEQNSKPEKSAAQNSKDDGAPKRSSAPRKQAENAESGNQAPAKSTMTDAESEESSKKLKGLWKKITQ